MHKHETPTKTKTNSIRIFDGYEMPLKQIVKIAFGTIFTWVVVVYGSAMFASAMKGIIW